MSNLTVAKQILPAMTQEDVSKVRALETVLRDVEQVPISTVHHFHAGLYARTICVKKGVVLTGALIKVPTLLTVSGDASVFVGGEVSRLVGYQVVPAFAGRKQVFYAHEDTYITMMFATEAKTVAEAEQEFTDEFALLVSRESDSDVVIRTD